MFLLAPLSVMMIYNQQKKDEVQAECEAASRSDRIRGAYENKIRFFSPPEKVFEIFASHKTEDGELVMTYSDFLEANSPYNHTALFKDSEDYIKDNNPQFFKKIDVSGEGFISFTEYFFFIVLLQVPSIKIKKAFKKYGGKMNQEQTSIELRNLRKDTKTGKKQQNKVAIDARLIKSSDESFMVTNKGIVE